MITPKSESYRMAYFYNAVKIKKRDQKRDQLFAILYLPHPMQRLLLVSDKRSYEIALAETMEAENFKDDFDQIWNLDDEIFNQIDVYGTEDIKTQIHKLQNTVTETAQDE